MSVSHIEMLASVLAGTRQRPVNALLTDIYPISLVESKRITGSVSVADIRDLTIIFEIPAVSGVVFIGEIVHESILSEHSTTEDNILGAVDISSITQVTTRVKRTEIEGGVFGAVSIESITQREVIITNDAKENSIVGSVGIDSINQT